MLNIPNETKVYIFSQASDMRKGFDSLAQLVENELGRQVLEGGLFVFFNRNKSRARILYWDGDGYALWYKRLEVGVFRVNLSGEHEELSGVDLRMLLAGVEQSRICFRKKYQGGAQLSNPW
jgi:transposase